MLSEILANCTQQHIQRQRLLDEAPFYPEYDITTVYDEDTEYHTHYIASKLRLNHESTWYIEGHLKSIKVHKDDALPNVKDILINELLKSVYLNLIAGEVNPELEDPYGNKLYPVDENQDSEIFRLLGVSDD